MSPPRTRQDCEVDILKEIFWRPVAQSPYGPVLAEEDVIGTKVRALADRRAPRDLIDVFAASRRWNTADLEEFGRRHARGRFEREDLQATSPEPSGPMTKPSPPTAWARPPSPLFVTGPWSGPTTSRPDSSKSPMIRTSTDRVRPTTGNGSPGKPSEGQVRCRGNIPTALGKLASHGRYGQRPTPPGSQATPRR